MTSRFVTSSKSTERVAIGLAVEESLGERRGRPKKENTQNFAELNQGKETAQVAAEKAGFGNKETYRQAKKVSNEASETSVPMTFVNYAEFIWGQEGTQQEVAEILGWSVSKVKDYSRLKKIDSEAWKVVVATFYSLTELQHDSRATEKVANATFTEGLLRPICNLTATQQLKLVKGLSDNSLSKVAFKKLAENFQQQNKDKSDLDSKLKDIVSPDIYEWALSELQTGTYKLDRLIQMALDKHNKNILIL
jgi:hypothetical protein